jgi:hypothetical protein
LTANVQIVVTTPNIAELADAVRLPNSAFDASAQHPSGEILPSSRPGRRLTSHLNPGLRPSWVHQSTINVSRRRKSASKPPVAPLTRCPAPLRAEPSSEETPAADDVEGSAADSNEPGSPPAPVARKLPFDISLDELPALEGSDDVTFTFAWPQSLEGSVRLERFTWRTEDESPRSPPTTGGEFALTTTKTADGLEVAIVARSLAQLPAAKTPDERQRLAALRGERMWVPAFVVGPQGIVRRVANAEQHLADHRAMLESHLGDGAAMPDSWAETLALPEALEAMVTRIWSPLVEEWTGETFRVGEPNVTRGEFAHPLADDKVAEPFEMKRIVHRWVPCPGLSERRCVLASLEFEPDESQAKILGSFLDTLDMPEGNKMKIISAEDSHTVTVVTDPATLIPYRLEMHARVEATLELPGGARQVYFTNQLERAAFRYDSL